MVRFDRRQRGESRHELDAKQPAETKGVSDEST